MANDFSFSDRLRELRKEKGLTTYQLADLVPVNQSYIAQLENGIRDVPSGKICSRLADIFGCTTDYLLGRAG